jgi:hypothetical protein
MAPIYLAGAPADSRHRELLRGADRRRLLAGLPPEPGLLQRFAPGCRLGSAAGGMSGGGGGGARAVGNLIGP